MEVLTNIVNWAGSVPNRSASRLAEPTTELSTTQVRPADNLCSFVMNLGDTPCQGSLPQSRSSSSCSPSTFNCRCSGRCDQE